MSFLPVIFLYIHTPIYYFHLFIDISKRFLGLIIMIQLWSCISCVRSNSSNSVSLLFPSWTLIDTEHVVETPKTCRVWILVLASPPRHIPEMNFFSYSFSTLLNVMWQPKWEGNLKKNRKKKQMNFEALDSMFQNSSRVFKKSAIDYYVSYLLNICYTCQTLLSDLHAIYYLILTPWG